MEGVTTGTGSGAKDSDTASGVKSAGTEPETGNGTHVPGASTLGDGQGKVVADEKGVIGAADSGNGTPTTTTAAATEKDGKEGKGLSRLWSRSRTSAEGRRRASVDEAGGKSPTSTRRMRSPPRSRFNEVSLVSLRCGLRGC